MKELESLYKTYYAQVYAFCLTLTRDRADAEDLAAETFYRAILHAGKFRGASKMSVWLCAIAKNAFYSERRRRRRPPPEVPVAAPPLSVEERESAEEILSAADGLPDPYRTVFLMRTVGEAPYAEVAALFGKGESWARVTYCRARGKIIAALRRKEREDGTKTP